MGSKRATNSESRSRQSYQSSKRIESMLHVGSSQEDVFQALPSHIRPDMPSLEVKSHDRLLKRWRGTDQGLTVAACTTPKKAVPDIVYAQIRKIAPPQYLLEHCVRIENREQARQREPIAVRGRTRLRAYTATFRTTATHPSHLITGQLYANGRFRTLTAFRHHGS